MNVTLRQTLVGTRVRYVARLTMGYSSTRTPGGVFSRERLVEGEAASGQPVLADLGVDDEGRRFVARLNFEVSPAAPSEVSSAPKTGPSTR